MFFINYLTIICPVIFTTYLINKYCYKSKKDNKKKYKKFDYKNTYYFDLKYIEVIKNDKIINNIDKHNSIITLCNDDIIINIIDFDFICINYTINNKKYKYITNKNRFKLYNNEDIKDYIYINNIHDCILKINYTTINIQNIIMTFLGPNYNFYYDLENKLNYINVIKYILIEINLYFSKEEISNSEINFKDNFMNEYNINSNTFDGYLNWKPTL